MSSTATTKKLVTFIIYDKPGATDKAFIRKSVFYSSSKKISDIILKLVEKKYSMFDPAHAVVLMEKKSKTDIICLLGFRVSYIYEVIGIGENWDVHVSIRSSHIPNPVRVANTFQRMMVAAIPTSMKTLSAFWLPKSTTFYLSTIVLII